MQSTCFHPIPGVAKPFSRWAGVTGASFVFSVYDLDKIPAYPHAVYIVVRNRGGVAEPLLIGATTDLPKLFFLGDRYRGALRRGGNAVHVHVPPQNGDATAVARDLSRKFSRALKGATPSRAFPFLTESL